MGFLDWLGLGPSVVNAVAGGAGISSPWSTTDLARVVWADIHGTTPPGISRTDAMKVPSIIRGRALVAGLLSKSPLVSFTDATPDAVQPAWLYRTNTGQSPQARTLWTYDDLIFSGYSLWDLTRDQTNEVLTGVRRRRDLWQINPTSHVIEGRPAITEPWKPLTTELCCLIEGPQEGLVTIAADTIRAARDMEAAWTQRVASPVPLVELHNTDPQVELDDDEIDDLIDTWEAKRRTGGTAYTPAKIEVKEHGTAPTDLYVQGRNALRLDIANYLSVPASLLEGSQSTASLTYSTSETKRNELVDLSLAYWAVPLEGRLSLDDMIPAGRSVRFDLSAMATPVQPATTPTMKD